MQKTFRVWLEKTSRSQSWIAEGEGETIGVYATQEGAEGRAIRALSLELTGRCDPETHLREIMRTALANGVEVTAEQIASIWAKACAQIDAEWEEA